MKINKAYDINELIESVKEYLTKDEYKVYSIIYARALASLMSDAKTLATTAVLDNNGYEFKVTGSILTFDGYLKVYKEFSKTDDVILPDFDKFNGVVSTKDIETEQKFTKPVSRYTEATLIQEMEELGIGRPSTYAKTMETLKMRDYVKIEDKKFVPTEIGIETTDKLQEYFSNIINVEYTANMETDLDLIAEENKDNIKILKDFYKATVEMLNRKVPIESFAKCLYQVRRIEAYKDPSVYSFDIDELIEIIDDYYMSENELEPSLNEQQSQLFKQLMLKRKSMEQTVIESIQELECISKISDNDKIEKDIKRIYLLNKLKELNELLRKNDIADSSKVKDAVKLIKK